jgi:peptide/nickel transport system substrate-binding protein
MAIFRRRLVFWIIRAYVKKWGRVIFFSFLFGLIVFFVLAMTSQKIIELIPFQKKQTIGMVGAYKVNNLPPEIFRQVSYGLTTIGNDGTIQPGVAEKWEVSNNGRTFTFHLKKDAKFADGDKVTSDKINYDFADVKTERPNKETIVYTLKDAYSPFLVTVARPIFKSGYVGVGNYRITDIELNGGFVKSLQIVSSKNKFDTVYYQFYPSEEALKLAFALGEVTDAADITNNSFQNRTFEQFPNAKLTKNTNYSKLVTIFYNNNDGILSDKKVRSALTYALPDTFTYGERSYVSYSPESQFHSAEQQAQDIDHAKLLLASSAEDNKRTKPVSITMKVQEKYMPVAKDIAKIWEGLGVKTKLEEVDALPSTFQVYLGDFTLPRDPDQYILWHSGQAQNITRYKNLRIDKLLEDGRKTTNTNERKEIYADFQKYLQDDAPAAFLYFPYTYEIARN